MRRKLVPFWGSHNTRESRCDGTSSIVKAKCTWVVCKEVYEAVNVELRTSSTKSRGNFITNGHLLFVMGALIL